MTSNEHLESNQALFAELADRAEELVGLGPGQLEGWASGLFTVLESDEEMIGFVEWSEANPSRGLALACAGVAALADPPVVAVADRVAAGLAEWLDDGDRDIVARLGGAQANGAWQIEAPFGRSLAVGFGPDPHVVLVEIDSEGRLVDLQLSEMAVLGLDDDSGGPPGVQVVVADPQTVLAQVASAWERLVQGSQAETGPGLHANLRLVRKRLQAAGHSVSVLSVSAGSADATRGMSPDEIARANRAARSTLRSAVGDPAAPDLVDPAWMGVIRGDIGGATARERDGLLWLEWADWLGVGIGLVRAGSGAAMDGSSLVDLINRCPEVSSTVPAGDRDYAEWALEVAADFLADAGLVADGRLSDRGAATLHGSLHAAWADPAEEPDEASQ